MQTFRTTFGLLAFTGVVCLLGSTGLVQADIACCLLDPYGTCVDTDPVTCAGLPGIESPSGDPACLGDNDGSGYDDACEPVAACCFDPSTCSVLTQADCEDGGGMWLGNGEIPVVSCAGDPCAGFSTGACCTGSACGVDFEDTCLRTNGYYLGDATTCAASPCATGACCIGSAFGCADDSGAMDEATCTGMGGTYVGSPLCSATPQPCGETVCAFADVDHCQPQTGQYILQSDRNLGVLRADDFEAVGSSISRVCWQFAFAPIGANPECSEAPPVDDFEIRFYEDAFGVPGTELTNSPYSVTPDGKAQLGPGLRTWSYTAPISPSATVTATDCYWIEITDVGTSTCSTNWVQSYDGNTYSMRDWNDGYSVSDGVTDDLVFCIDSGIVEATQPGVDGGCGDLPVACCKPDETCGDAGTLSACAAAAGVSFPYSSCGSVTCPLPANDDCANATLACDGETPNGDVGACDNADDLDPGPVCSVSGQDCYDSSTCVAWPNHGYRCQQETDSRLATTDGPTTSGDCFPSGENSLQADIWYDVVAPCTGELVISMCNAIAKYDAMLAVYGDHTDTCVCPGVSNDAFLVCNDDFCGQASVSGVQTSVLKDACYTIRVGGWSGSGTPADAAQGISELDIGFLCDTVPPDPHATVGGGLTFIDFGLGGEIPPLPVDFFEPGSDPFEGIVGLEGDPPDPDSSNSSTEIQRDGNVVFPGPPPSSMSPIEVEIVALSLRSIDPITVTYFGEMPSEQWDVHVGLSDDPQPAGALAANLTHANGGTYDVTVAVLPKLTFTKVSDPEHVVVLDYGGSGPGYLSLDLSDAPFVIDLGPDLVGTILAPSDGNFVPGVQEVVPGNPLTQVVAAGTGVSTGGSVAHRVGPAVPPPPAPPGLPSDPTHQARKNRYISIDATTNPTKTVAIQVALSSMKRCSGDDRRACTVNGDCPKVCDNDNDLECVDDTMCSEGGTCVLTSPCVEHSDVCREVGWVDTPFANTCTPLGDCTGEWFARVAGAPVYRVWTEDVVHITDCVIVPAAVYELRARESGGNPGDPLTIATIAKPSVDYGDCAGVFDPYVGAFTPPDGVTNVTDLMAVQFAAAENPGAPHTTWFDSMGPDDPSEPEQAVNFADVAFILYGLQGRTYSETFRLYDPCTCPTPCGSVVPGCGSAFCDDGTCDPNEDQCNCPGDCGTPPSSEIPAESCTDGRDNDCDGPVDCADSDCSADSACTPGSQVIEWMPAAASGNVICMPGAGECGDHEIILSDTGVTVTLFLQVSGWDPEADNDPLLGAFQATVDSSGYASGAGSPLVPVGSDAGTGYEGAFCAKQVCGTWECEIDPDDPGCEWDPLIDCEYAPEICPPEYPSCIGRPDYIFYQLDDVEIVSTATLDYSWYALSTDCAADPDGGTTKFYGGTLLVEIPSGAKGTYNIGFVDDAKLTLVNTCPGPRIAGGAHVPAQITVQTGGCCYGIGTQNPTCLEDVTEPECMAMPAPRLFDPDSTCPEIGCDPCTGSPACDDSNVCTDDSCDPVFGCVHSPNYDDAFYCCHPTSGSLTLLDDGIVCTNDVCDPETGIITHPPEVAGTACGDPSETECTNPDTCSGLGSCRVNHTLDGTLCGCLGECSSGVCVVAAADCNNNRISDDCEIDENSTAPGGPFYCDPASPPVGLDQCDPDCNDNGIPDECDISECGGSAACDDCNLNDVPDECDDPIDNIPDECVFFTDQGSTENWSDFGNWDLGGADYPDNDEVDYSVTLGGTEDQVVLDVTVTVDTLGVESGARLDVTGGNLTVSEVGGIEVDGGPLGASFTNRAGFTALFVGADDWIDTTNTGVERAGELLVEGAADITVSGQLTIGPGGRYQADPAATGVSATLTAGTVEIVGSSCDSDFNGGSITLTDKMLLEVAGDLILQGSEEASCGPQRGGITPPPGLDVGCGGGGLRTGSPTVVVGGDLMMIRSVMVSICSMARRGVAGNSIILWGSFFNESTSPEGFEASNGRLLLAGTDPERTFEVGSRNFGATTDGFQRGECSISGNLCGGFIDPPCPGGETCGLQTNFSLGTLEIAGESHVTCVDESDNDGLGPDRIEALYVDNLVFGADAQVIIKDCSVFYRTLTANDVTPDVRGTGEFAKALPAWPPEPAAYPHDAQKNRYISIDPTANGFGPVAYQVAVTSMKRCSGDDRRACLNDEDCPGVCDNDIDLQCTDDEICSGGTCLSTSPCVEHTNVGSVTRFIDVPFESSCVPLDDCSGQWFANLVSSPVYRVWTENVLHISDCEIVPVAAYEVRATADGSIFSEPLTIGTIEKPQVHYGDCVGPVVAGAFSPPDGFSNVTDVQAYLLANQGGASAPHTTWVDLHSSSAPVVPQQILNVGDLQTIKFGFLGQTYVETPGQENPGGCP